MRSVSCNLCGADDWEVRFAATENVDAGLDTRAFRCTHDGYGSHTQIVTCRICGHVYANPRWDPDELMEAYASVEDALYVDEREGREKTFARHLRSIENYAGSGSGQSLLDVGAYIGVFVEIARSQGWDAQGVEPSRWAVEEAESLGLPVFEGTLEAGHLDGKQFDVVTLWDVIEHMDDPSAELSRIFALLKPGGYIAVHTMDIDSLASKMMGSRWPWLMDMHIHYFSRTTLTKMLEKKGFDVLWVGSQGRFLSFGYLASRVGGMSHALGRVFLWLVKKLGIAEKTLSLNFGDLITAIARKPHHPSYPE